MNLWNTIKGYFGGLRNKPGGLARIKGLGDGCDSLNGRYVITQRVNDLGFWVVEPPQSFTPTVRIRDNTGCVASAGDRCTLISIGDQHLEPVPEVGITKDEVTELYQPGPKVKETA